MTVDKQGLAEIAKAIRGLSIDAIDKANSGHPGLPLGCADLTAALFAGHLRYNPNDPQWEGRDRFVLSAGHGSMLLYSILHLAGYGISLDDIKQFRQLHSPCAGHPEYGEAPGIETTTGPLGQGMAMGIGMAINQKALAARTGFSGFNDSRVFILAGDGCLMEGVSAEAASLAGHLGLDNVVVIYDANDICLDGPITECFTESVQKRFEAYGWDVMTIDGHDVDAVNKAYSWAESKNQKPKLICAKTTIGYGSPNRGGTSEAHGKPLGEEEAALTKQALGISLEKFYVSSEVKELFKSITAEKVRAYDAWNESFSTWLSDPSNKQQWALFTDVNTTVSDAKPTLLEKDLKPNQPTRSSSSEFIQVLAKEFPFILGGSADLSCSDNTMIKDVGIITKDDFSKRNIKFGVREFAMSAIQTGIALQGRFKPFCGTFLTFSDYMKNSIRLAALMNVNVIYQLTHDTIFLGEDGPTHQPIEHLASLRSIPNVKVFRPADEDEVKGAWLSALTSSGPAALVLSRQKIVSLPFTDATAVEKGAYICHTSEKDSADFCIIATGAELGLAWEVTQALEQNGFSVRLVSMPCFENFENQSDAYKEATLGGNIKQFVSIEAQSSFGWHKYIGKDGIAISMDSFGLSANADDLAKHFGFTREAILARLIKVPA